MRRTMLSRLHLAVGLGGIVAFLITGLYMHFALGHLRDVDDLARALFRSSHIYLLWSSLLNCALGLAAPPAQPARVRGLERCGALAVLIGPPLLLAGFFTEPLRTDWARPWGYPAIVLALAGILSILVARWRSPGPSSE